MKVLTLSEMFAAAEETSMKGADKKKKAILTAIQQFGKELAAHLGIKILGECRDEFGDVSMGFGPRENRQECPEVIERLDPISSWRYRDGGEGES